MHLSHLGVAIADRIGQRGRHSGPPEQDLVRRGGLAPEPVVAREQDLVALRINGVDPELPTGHLQRPGHAGGEAARDVFDDMGRQQSVEQFPPGRVGLGEGDHRGLATVDRLDTGDQVVAGRVDNTGLAHHLAPQVPEVVGRDGSVIGPRGLGRNFVGDGERASAGHRGRYQ